MKSNRQPPVRAASLFLRHLLAGFGVGLVGGITAGILAARPPEILRGTFYFITSRLQFELDRLFGDGLYRFLAADIRGSAITYAVVCALAGIAGGAALGVIGIIFRRDRQPAHPSRVLALYIGLFCAALSFAGVMTLLANLDAPKLEIRFLLLVLSVTLLFWIITWSFSRFVLGAVHFRGMGVLVVLGSCAFLFLPQPNRQSGGSPKTPDEAPNIVLIGVDGATWTVIDRMIQVGRLPNLHKLINDGSSGSLRSLHVTHTPVIWTSIATGKLPRKHGILHFVARTEEDGPEVPVRSDMRKCKAFWNILSELDLSVDLLGWQVSWPVEPINGVNITDRFSFTQMDRTTYPASIKERMELLLDSYEGMEEEVLTRLVYDSPFLIKGGMRPTDQLALSYLRKACRQDTVVFQAGRDLLNQTQAKLFALYIVGPDRVQHNFWAERSLKLQQPGSGQLYKGMAADRVKQFGGTIESYYGLVDEMIGAIVSRCSKDSIFIIVSDHGSGLGMPQESGALIRPNPLLEAMGMLAFREGGSAIDWERTRVYDFGNPPSSSSRNLYINVRGRGDRGVVEPEDYEDERRQVMHALKSVQNQSGLSAIRSIDPVPKDDPLDEGADLVVSFDVEALSGELIHPKGTIKADLLAVPAKLTGQHRTDGVIIMSGPGIRADAEIQDATVLDITPTILYLLGLPVARDMDGKALVKAVDDDHRYPIEYRDTYDTEGWRAGESLSIVEDSEILESLRALGYIE